MTRTRKPFNRSYRATTSRTAGLSKDDLIAKYLGGESPEAFYCIEDINDYFDPKNLDYMFGPTGGHPDAAEAKQAVIEAWRERHLTQTTVDDYNSSPAGRKKPYTGPRRASTRAVEEEECDQTDEVCKKQHGPKPGSAAEYYMQQELQRNDDYNAGRHKYCGSARSAGVTSVDQVRIYIADLDAYNNGKLKGEWLDLPADPDDIQAALHRHSRGGTGDYAIHDFEAPFTIRESEDIFALNDLLQAMEEKDIPLSVIAALIDRGYSKQDVMNSVEDLVIFAGNATEYLTEMGYLSELPEWAEAYFDYEAYARDMESNGAFIELREDNLVISGF